MSKSQNIRETIKWTQFEVGGGLITARIYRERGGEHGHVEK